MKTLTKIALAALIATAAAAAQADWVRGHFRSNGTFVAPYYRTPANGIPYDNLSYRGYPSQQPGYISPRSYDLDSSTSRGRRHTDSDFGLPSPSFTAPRTLPAFNSDFQVRPLGGSPFGF